MDEIPLWDPPIDIPPSFEALNKRITDAIRQAVLGGTAVMVAQQQPKRGSTMRLKFLEKISNPEQHRSGGIAREPFRYRIPNGALWTAATDGALLVTVCADDSTYPEKQEHYEKVNRNLEPMTTCLHPLGMLMASIGIPDYTEQVCTDCQGSGQVECGNCDDDGEIADDEPRECTVCDGSGEQDCDCGEGCCRGRTYCEAGCESGTYTPEDQWLTCPDCDGTRERECDECDTERIPLRPVWIGGAVYNAELIARALHGLVKLRSLQPNAVQIGFGKSKATDAHVLLIRSEFKWSVTVASMSSYAGDWNAESYAKIASAPEIKLIDAKVQQPEDIRERFKTLRGVANDETRRHNEREAKKAEKEKRHCKYHAPYGDARLPDHVLAMTDELPTKPDHSRMFQRWRDVDVVEAMIQVEKRAKTATMEWPRCRITNDPVKLKSGYNNKEVYAYWECTSCKEGR